MRQVISVSLFAVGAIALWSVLPTSVTARELTNDLSLSTAEDLSKVAAFGGAYKPRTEHFQSDGSPTYTNRLIDETSPYLIQHAHNPVNWYPWGEEAFAIAQEQNKPVFLSIGYATCHWCHVMERESFENEEIAAELNRNYISIKVDREERPDVDQIYMTAVQLMEQRGGWPLTAFLTNQRAPFFGGTYFPPDSFMELLGQVKGAWRTQNLDLVLYGDNVNRAVSGYLNSAQQAGEFSDQAMIQAADDLLSRADSLQGGTGSAPKFPQEPAWTLMASVLPWLDAERQASVLEVFELTLDELQRGGIRDHIGGGFHRYSTDDAWLVPHFEKMLYNQAQLATLFLDGYWLTGRADFLATATDTLDYVAKEMRTADGLFYSATDADSLNRFGELEEGAFFIWTLDELIEVVGNEATEELAPLLGVTSLGNWENSNVIHLPATLTEEQAALVAKWRSTIYEARLKRPAPLLDNKTIAGWNGLMIPAYARAAKILAGTEKGARYRDIVETALDSLLRLHWDTERQTVIRISIDGTIGGIDGMVDDYSGSILSLLEGYDLTGNPEWLNIASQMGEQLVEQFTEGGVVYMTSIAGADSLTFRPTESYDGAQPSGRSMAFAALVGLFTRSGEIRWEDAANKVLGAMAGNLNEDPLAAATAVVAALRFHQSSRRSEVITQAASGVVSIRVDNDKVILTPQGKWHLNSNQPLSEDYIPTRIMGAKTVSYPEGVERVFGFSDEKLSVYEGEVTLPFDVDEGQQSVDIELQACSDEICLPPEQLTLFLPFSLGR